jgi:crotonobetainyl-CoA:carnitine CoA-transferase CaiB-like acyl-CoA transferase
MTHPPMPLEGVKVLDLSRWIAGPVCSMLLADMGADVIKVERPGGEDARDLEPRLGDESAYVLHYHRNKRGITVNTRDADGVAILRRLVAWADVLVENYRPGTLEAMGLGPAELEKLNPGLVVTSISGFGQTGPWRHRPLFNPIAEAMSGLMARTGSPETGPLISGNFTADHTAGLYAAFATVVALFSRTRTGLGQHADVSLFDSMFSLLGYPVTAALNNVPVAPPAGNRDPVTAPGNIFATADQRYVYIDAATDGLFRALAAAMGAPELGTDPRFRTQADRMANVVELEALVEKWTRGKALDEICDLLDRAHVPSGPVCSVEEACDNPQLRAREMVVSLPDEQHGDLRLPGVAVKLSRTPGQVRRRPPTVGEHTAEVLVDICGFTEDEIAALRGRGAV